MAQKCIERRLDYAYRQELEYHVLQRRHNSGKDSHTDRAIHSAGECPFFSTSRVLNLLTVLPFRA